MSTDQTTTCVVTDARLTFRLKRWSRCQKSQSAVQVCAGGVSAVTGTYDLDEHIFSSAATPGNQLSFSLPFQCCGTNCGNDVVAEQVLVYEPSQGMKRLF